MAASSREYNYRAGLRSRPLTEDALLELLTKAARDLDEARSARDRHRGKSLAHRGRDLQIARARIDQNQAAIRRELARLRHGVGAGTKLEPDLRSLSKRAQAERRLLRRMLGEL